MKSSKFISIYLFILILSNGELIAQKEIGKGSEFRGLQGKVQKWLLVDNDSPIITIEGIVNKIKLNDNGNFYDDIDWNVFLKPSPEFDWCLFNSENQKTWDNLIEMEVKSKKTDIRLFFEKDEKVIAKGNWVEDTGHGASNPDLPARYVLTTSGIKYIAGKTEIHPLTMLRTGTKVSEPNTIGYYSNIPSKIFMAQDATGRFYDADRIPIQESFSFHSKNGPYFIINPLSDLIGQGLVDIYRESSNIKGGAIAKLDHINEVMSYEVYIPPYNSAEGGAFMGVFSNEESKLVNFKTKTTSINGTHPGANELKIEVELELLNPPGVNFLKRWWAWEENFSNGEKVWFSTEDHTKINYELIYAPSRGLTSHSWDGYILGNSNPWGWYPTSTTSPSERVVGISRYKIGFNPSEVSLIEKEIKGTGCDRTSSQMSTSIIGYFINLESKLLQNSQLINSDWYIKVIVDGDGRTITNPIETKINTGSQEIQGISVYLAPAGNSVQAKFKNHSSSRIMPGRTESVTIISEVGKFQIIFKGKDSFSQLLSATTSELEGRGITCMHDFGIEIIDELVIIKGLMAVAKLRDLGILPDSITLDRIPDPVIPGWDSIEFLSYGELYAFEKIFTGEKERLVKQMILLSNGLEIDPRDLLKIVKFQQWAMKIPEPKFRNTNIVSKIPLSQLSLNSPMNKPKNIINLSKPIVQKPKNFWRKIEKKKSIIVR